MPELPEVETVMRGLKPALEGRRICRVVQRRADLRFPFPERFAERLEGKRFEGLSRRAKYILAAIEGGEVLVIHLGMTGRFTISTANEASAPGRFHHVAGQHAAHDHLMLDMEGGLRVTYNDARRFGYMTLIAGADLAGHEHFKHLGIEPLGNELSPEFLARVALGKRTDLKTLLMDQRIIAGLGNIYVCEALYRSGLSPLKPASVLATRAGKPTEKAQRLAPTIRAVLEEAVAAGGSSLRDYRQADGSLGYFQHAFQIYGREGKPCVSPGCRGIVRRTIQGGRSTFHCAVCQR
jgi:formamidopyrimidine-DNA glycosylase